MALAILPVLVLSAWEHRKTRPLNVSRVSHFRAVLSWTERNEPIPYLEALVATALAVALAAHAVMVWRLDHGQWMIWSAASVITGDLTSGRQKLRDRMVSALMGVPAGIGAGIFLPHSAFAYDLASLVAVLTLVAVRPYACLRSALCLRFAGPRARGPIIGHGRRTGLTRHPRGTDRPYRHVRSARCGSASNEHNTRFPVSR